MPITEAANTAQLMADGNTIVSGLQSGWGGLLIVVIIIVAIGAGLNKNGGVKSAVIILLVGAVLVALFYSPMILRTFGEGITNMFT